MPTRTRTILRFVGPLLCVVILAVLAVAVTVQITRSRAPAAIGSAAGSPPAAELERLRVDAAAAFNHGQFQQAQALVQQLLDHRPDDTDAHLLMAEVLLGQERTGQAYEHIAAALKLDPDQEEAQFFAGVVASRIDRWKDAARHHAKAAALNSKSAKHPLHLGIALLNLNRADEAQLQALRAQQLDGSAPEVYLLLAQIADRRSKPDMAIDMLDKATALMRSDDLRRLDYTLYKSQLLRRTARPEQAINLLTALDPRDQQQERTINELAQNYLLLGQPGKAAACWAELFALQPGSARAAAEAGLCMLRAGEDRQAQRYLGYAQALDPRHHTVAALAKAVASARAIAPGEAKN